MQLEILNVPEKALREKSKKVESFDRPLQEFLLDLEETLKKHKDPEGVGLSAPQLGRNIRAFVTNLRNKPRIYINPEIVDLSDEKTLGGSEDRPVLEGCLSIPRLYGPVWRSKKVKVKAQDKNGEYFTKTLTSFEARVFLHELDHLDGVLFTDYTIKDEMELYLLQDEEFVRIDEPSEIIKW